ncbi:MAG: phosphate regulon transcriptional regulator PhoB [Alcanivorax sp.]|jgi:two-component system phosphate regulon response regulator PhoB|nr:MAG: phosphate regulon transcriptional regulatory protein PhoB [Oceanobacter sp.]|tara:strand:- start:328 stop:1020 length:693 start_codon:yes stop_codon:yes gene_type:complete
MSGGFILVVDDEPAICDMICTSLEMAGYQTRKAANGQIALQMIFNEQPDLAILDWMMPMMSGIELTTRIKRDPLTAEIPIILLTARSVEEDKIRGLEAGADDYVVKPFSPRELTARVKAVLRRSGKGNEDSNLTAGTMVLSPDEQVCRIDNETVSMGPKELKLLEFFMRHPNRVFSRGQLLDRVWGGNVYIDERTVDVHIRRLRKAITMNDHERMIQTVRGSGYRFSCDI